MTDTITHVTDTPSSAAPSIAGSDCPVCCSAYTGTIRRPVPCASCSYAACVSCVKGFLLSTKAEPHCMNCRHVWNREFLDAHLTRSWREGELKRHREAVLFDRERSLLPSSQDAIQARHEKDAAEKALKEARVELKALAARKVELKAIVDRNQYFIENGRWPDIAAPTMIQGFAFPAPPAPESTKRQFIAACPDADCRGFLSTAYKCGVCAKQFCSKCREPKAPEESDTHTCDPALVATIKAILADSRPCPHCGTAISRVSGCDQMFCTQCNTAFSYSTGKVVTGVIHNPHYFERLAKLKKEGAAATAGGGYEVACGANGWPTYYTVVSGHPILRYVDKTTNAAMGRLYQLGVHIQEVELPGLPDPTRPQDNTDLRVQYLLKEIDDKQFRQKLQQRERVRTRDLEFRGPLELAVVTILEFYVWLSQPAQRVLARRTEIAHEIEVRTRAVIDFLDGYINKSLRDIGDRYANQAPQFVLFTGNRYRLQWGAYKPAKTTKKATAAKATPSDSSSLSE